MIRKKLMWFILLAVLMAVCCSVAFAGNEGNWGNNIQWSLDDEGVLVISGTGTIRDFDRNSTAAWLANKNTIKQVIINDGITGIGKYAFDDCKSLTNVSLPDSVTEIGNYAFSGCSALMQINLPDSLTGIGKYSFSLCSKLTEVFIPDNLISIDKTAFYGCSMVRYAHMGTEGAKALGKGSYSFREPGEKYNLKYYLSDDKITDIVLLEADKDITSVVIPDGVTSIYGSAFENCTELDSVFIPDTVKNIYSSAFFHCINLSKINLPEGLTTITPMVFFGCVKLNSIHIPESVTTIGYSAFHGCQGLTNVTIPKNVATIGDYAFLSCSSLQHVLFTTRNLSHEITFGKSVFGDSNPTYYCYMYTAPDIWCEQNNKTPEYLDELNIETIRQISLVGDLCMVCGSLKQLTVNVFPDDTVPMHWSSSNPTVLAIENGLLSALNPGVSTITVTVGEASESITVRVFPAATAIELNEKELWLQAKETVKLSASVIAPENAIAEITWDSSDPSRAFVVGDGSVKTLRPGDVTITATTESGISSSCLLHLCYPVKSVHFEDVNAPVVCKCQLKTNVETADATYVNKLVSFSSSDESILTVNQNGVVSGESNGTATIYATAFSGETASIELTVSLIDNIMVLPSGLRNIEDEAFAGTHIKAIIIPDGCLSIGKRAFSECDDLQYVWIPKSVVTIHESAFDNSNILFEYER